MGYIFSLLSLSKSAAEGALDGSEIAIVVAGFLLALGAIGEYLEEHKRLARWMMWPKLVFILMVVTSLVCEFVSDAGVFVFSRQLQKIEGDEIEALDERAKAALDKANEGIRKAHDATSSADNARGAADRANSVASVATQSARTALQEVNSADRMLAVLEQQAVVIQRKIAWRTISPQRAREVRDALPSFVSGVSLQIATLPEDREAQSYGKKLADTLNRSGLRIDGVGSIAIALQTETPTGLELMAGENDRTFAEQIAKALRKAGINIRLTIHPGSRPVPLLFV